MPNTRKTHEVVLNIAGGSNKALGLLGASRAILENDNRVTLITGVGSGGALALPLAMGLYEEVYKIAVNITPDTLFRIKPFTKLGQLSWKTLWRLLKGKPGLGVTNLPTLFRDLITDEKFDLYKYDKSYPDVEIGVVDFVTGGLHYYNVRNLNYAEYLTIFRASNSVPVIHSPVYYEDKILFNGGVRENISTLSVLEKFCPAVCYNVYSKPEDNRVLDIGWEAQNIYSITERVTQIRAVESEKATQRLTDYIKPKDCIVHNVFLPKVLTGLYDTNKNRLRYLYDEGYQRALKIFTHNQI